MFRTNVARGYGCCLKEGCRKGKKAGTLLLRGVEFPALCDAAWLWLRGGLFDVGCDELVPFSVYVDDFYLVVVFEMLA